MVLQEAILAVLQQHQCPPISLQGIYTGVKNLGFNFSDDQIFSMISRMRGKSLVRFYDIKSQCYCYSIIVEQNEGPLIRTSIKSSQREVIAKQVLSGKKIEEAAAAFSCRPLTVIRKVQQFCMMQDPDLYHSLIPDSRKTPNIDDLRRAFASELQ